MSYLVLARKYRPRNFSEMVGQEHVVQALSNALTQQRLHHAYLFTGTRGVGKTTVSRILAKSLNCTGADGQGGITAAPCGACPACMDIDYGRFVDYTELDAASNRGVDEVQQLLEQAVYKPVQGRFKVFMIDEVHMLTNTAFNAMLKTLEEPPEYLKFVLATTDPQKVPVTVLSRCLQFNLRPMAPETVLQHLGHVLDTENVPAEPQALRLLARAARGSMRDALSLTDQAIAFGSGRLEEAAVRQMLGSVDRGAVFSLIAALAAADGRAVVELVEQLRAAGLSAATALEDMASVLQRMAVHQAVPGMAIDDTDPEAQETARLAALLPADETQLLYSLCIHGRAELGLAPDEYAGLTMVLLRLLPFKSAPGAPAEKKTLKSADAAPVAAVPVQAPPASGILAPPLAPPAMPAPRQPPAVGMPAESPAETNDESQPSIGLGVDENGFAPPDAEPAGEPGTADDGFASDDGPVAAPPRAHPPLQPMPVREQSAPRVFHEENRPPTLSHKAPAASEIVAVRVREGHDSQSPRVPATLEAPPSVVPGAHGDFWHALVQDLVAREAVAALVRELALQAELVARTDGQWTLRVESESLGQSGARDRLQAALADAGHAVRLHVEIGRVTDTPSRRNAIAAAARLKAAEALLMADPFVQEMLRDFGGRVVAGSIKPL
ncbi:DNA polymerase III subunit gamma/tau [Ottowia testudinis]|uniref:DNA polymerase III subunit gamma/tau n=1 Tax=Ottowia testudinis TaxID=2816950 RepID=A0A975CEC3_9BURK|nr:DNA polymerase III subunit gamma/tau [Ottowia testudinis]QTD44211.1 DNA polymerase III subunit gamma/tau [Ottowia testudinis]